MFKFATLQCLIKRCHLRHYVIGADKNNSTLSRRIPNDPTCPNCNHGESVTQTHIPWGCKNSPPSEALLPAPSAQSGDQLLPQPDKTSQFALISWAQDVAATWWSHITHLPEFPTPVENKVASLFLSPDERCLVSLSAEFDGQRCDKESRSNRWQLKKKKEWAVKDSSTGRKVDSEYEE